MEWLAKLVYGIGTIVVAVTLWVGKVQWTMSAHATEIETEKTERKAEIKEFKSEFKDELKARNENDKKLIDFMGRVDERLKRMEQKL